MSAFSTKLSEHVEAYIALRRTLGFALGKQAAILRALVAYVDADGGFRRCRPPIPI